MNLIILDSDAADVSLPLLDERAVHITNVLRRNPGDAFDVGLADGRIGKAAVKSVESDRIFLAVKWHGVSSPLFPIDLIVGLPRPQTARRLLREMTSMGARSLSFCGTDRGEKGYRTSKLWSSDEYLRHLTSGAQQAFNPRMPTVAHYEDLESALRSVEPGSDLIALDNYEATGPLSTWTQGHTSVVLALGAERGWSQAEREQLRLAGFQIRNLGERVLRMETAATSAVSIVLAQMGLF